MSGIQIKDLTAGYKAKKEDKVILTNVNSSLDEGKLVCLLGINGSGKSTLLRTLGGFQDLSLIHI